MHDISISPLDPRGVYPDDPPTRVTAVGDLAVQGYRLSCLQMSLHAGTHIDFPAHFIAGGKQADDYGIEEFILRAQVVEAQNATALIDGLPPGEAVLIKTQKLRGPLAAKGLSLELAELCASRRLALVGIDQISVDTDEGDYPIHRTLLGAGVLILENLDLSQVAAGKYQLICLPLITSKVEASPVRAVLLPIHEGENR